MRPEAHPAAPSARLERPNALTAAHARFARAAFVIYVATAAVSVALLVVSLVTDKAHDEEQTSAKLLLETDVRARSLSQRLDLLVKELRRLSQRAELDLRDRDLAPEKSLLSIAHERSTFFNVGVAILDTKGDVIWSEPAAFLSGGVSFREAPWFGRLRSGKARRIVPSQEGRADSVLYLVSPLVKGEEFTGALLGAIDLAHGVSLTGGGGSGSRSSRILTTRDGEVVYPPVAPSLTQDPQWTALLEAARGEPFVKRIVLEGVPRVVAVSHVSGGQLLLMSIDREDELFRAVHTRLRARLVIGLALALLPAVLLLLLLQRSLKLFRRSGESALREERLQLLGEAASSIAHEVKNALNGLSMGLELVMRAPPAGATPPVQRSAEERRERIIGELRREIQRLSDFTTELMTFSRGVELRRTRIDLTDFVPKVTGLLRDAAEECGGEIEVIVPPDPVWVEADAALLHAVIGNLAGNALDAATAVSPTPRVEVRADAEAEIARITVSDNGKGVSPTMQPRLFEPFQTEKANGVGIGLALARKIARAHGGELVLAEAQSERPGFPGASFVLTLPRVAAEEP
jgi:signal transduction histidine kinase